MSLLLLAPRLYGFRGGVQTYMCRLREIVTDLGARSAVPHHCVSWLDHAQDPDYHRHPVDAERFTACRGGKYAFAWHALRFAARHRGAVAIMGDLGQAKVAWLLRRCGLIRAYVLVVHGLEAWTRAPWIQRAAARAASVIVAPTEYTAREFAKHNGLPPGRVLVIPLAVADERLEFSARGEANGGPLRVLTVARLWSRQTYKGVDTLIAAVARLREGADQVSLSVVGEGDDLPRLRALAQELGVETQVTFLGSVPEARLRELYGTCDVFAMPSSGEGFGLVYVEAMRHGKPCIAANSGGAPEVVEHGVTGYLVEYGDAAAIADYLRALRRHPVLRAELGRRGHEKVGAEYLFGRMRERWCQVLRGLLRSA